MTVPGVNLICAASFIAAVGDPNRFMTSRKLVAYLGLDPVSGSPARRRRAAAASASAARRPRAGRSSRPRGPRSTSPARCTPSISAPRARRGHGKAVVATARKLAVLFWCMLTRDQDYAHQQPSLTRKKLRRLEITAGAPKYTRRAAGIWSTNDLMRDRRARARPAKPRPPTSGWSKTNKPAGRRKKWARARHRSAHRLGHSEGHKPRGRPKLLTSALRYVSHPRPTNNLRLRQPRWQDRRPRPAAQIPAKTRRSTRRPTTTSSQETI